jgi:hypothetical protein
MMKKLKLVTYISLIYLLYSTSIASVNIELLCIDINTQTCDVNTAQSDLASELINNIEPALFDHQYFITESNKYSQKLENIKNEWKDFARYLGSLSRDGQFYFYSKSDSKNLEKNTKTLSNLFKGFEELKIVHERIRQLKTKVKSKAIVGNGLWIQNLEYEKNLLEAYKKDLSSHYFWWSGEDLDQLLEDPDDDKMVKFLNENIRKTLTEVSDIKSKLYLSNSDIEKKMRLQPQHNFLNLTQKLHPRFTDQVITSAFMDWSNKSTAERKSWCNISKKHKFTSQKLENISNIFNGSLVVLSILPTPIALAMRTKTALQMASRIQTSSLGILTTSMALDYNKKVNECATIHVNYISSPSKRELKKWEECLSNEDQLKTNLLIAVLPAGFVGRLPLLASKILASGKAGKIIPQKFSTDMAMSASIEKNAKLIGTDELTGAISISHTGGVISQINAKTAVKLGDTDIDSYLYDYFDFVGKVYKDRIKLSTSEVNSFVASAKEMTDRMYVVTKTSNIPKFRNNKFQGGISLITSNGHKQKLPVEKALPDLRIQRSKGDVIVEMSRLVVAKDAEKLDHRLIKDLLVQSVELVIANPNVKKFVYFTTKAHHVLYRRLGINGFVIKKLGSAGNQRVVVEVDRAKAEAFLKKLKAESATYSRVTQN